MDRRGVYPHNIWLGVVLVVAFVRALWTAVASGSCSEVLLDPLVLPLRQSVGLGVEGGRQVLFDMKVRAEGGGEVRGESRVPV